MKLFLSRIKDSPEKRYLELKDSHPELLEQVPHHYIASYLGITPVSLKLNSKKNFRALTKVNATISFKVYTLNINKQNIRGDIC